VLELADGLRRFDAAARVPLVDGDAVYVVGRVEDAAGGPFRTGARRLVADGRRYFIGRGTAADFGAQLAAHESLRLVRLALVHLVAAITVLGWIGLRPYL
jgi:hypothetical protein